MTKICIINVVGLTPRHLQHAPKIAQVAKGKPFQGSVPAVTTTAQATMLTGKHPREHGVVGNGWYFRETGEIRFWQQARALIQSDVFYQDYQTAKMFWWFNQGAKTRWSATPKPYYGCDGSKEFGILDQTDCQLEKSLGKFPFHTFWGPMAGLPCSRWIAKATAQVLTQKKPEITLAYLPHLDYDFQRYEFQDPQRILEVDHAAGEIIDAADKVGAQVVVVSEYGIQPVNRSISINQHLRRNGWLTVRDGPYGENLMPQDSKVFAVADHQVAHIYVDGVPLKEVSQFLMEIPGIDRVVSPESLHLDHPRSGELIALAKPDSWFNYYYWLDETRSPDFAPTVDIHRKPGYDPCELFGTSKVRMAGRLIQKKLGFRYKMDVIPLDPTLVKGSHGLEPADPLDGAVIVGRDAPDSMLDFKDYVLSILRR